MGPDTNRGAIERRYRMTCHRGVCLAFSITAFLSCPVLTHSQSFSSYVDFQNMSVSDLATLQVKITDVGPHTKGARTLVITTPNHPYDLTLFGPYYRTQFRRDYDGDFATTVTAFRASAQALKAMIDSVGRLPAITDGDVDTNGRVSFSMHNVVGANTKVFEAIVNTANGRDLFSKMLATLGASHSAAVALTDQACDLGMLAGSPPADATSQVMIKMKGVRQDRKTGQYVGVVRVTNTSATALAAPVILVLVPIGNVTLANADGRTCLIVPSGAPYKGLQVASSLAPAQAVEVTLRFDNPDSESITFVQRKVFAGSGTR